MNEKELKKFISSKKNQRNAEQLAIQLQTINKNWVTVDQVAEKTKDDHSAIKNKLNVLCIMGYCVTDIIDGQQKYKIMIEKDQKKRFYENKIAELESDIADLKKEIEALS